MARSSALVNIGRICFKRGVAETPVEGESSRVDVTCDMALNPGCGIAPGSPGSIVHGRIMKTVLDVCTWRNW